MYRNLGDGRFNRCDSESRADRITKFGGMWSVSAGWFDYDNDGWSTSSSSNYVVWDANTEPRCGRLSAKVLSPERDKGLPDQLFHNNHEVPSRMLAASGISPPHWKGHGRGVRGHDATG